VDVEQDGELLERIKSIRRQIAQEIGIVVPSIHIQDNMKLKPGAYSILLKGVEVASGELMINHLMAMNPGAMQRAKLTALTREPTYGLEAFWINPATREDANSKGIHRGGSGHDHDHASFRCDSPPCARVGRAPGNPENA
jgi:flagellar biosynthesis protein FlhA